jgi:hypothetical protein
LLLRSGQALAGLEFGDSIPVLSRNPVLKCTTLSLCIHFAHNCFVDVAPDPFFSGLDRAHDGMVDVMEVFGGVFVLGGIAATHMAARHAHAKVNPRIADLHAIFTDVRVGRGDFDLI